MDNLADYRQMPQCVDCSYLHFSTLDVFGHISSIYLTVYTQKKSTTLYISLSLGYIFSTLMCIFSLVI